MRKGFKVTGMEGGRHAEGLTCDGKQAGRERKGCQVVGRQRESRK